MPATKSGRQSMRRPATKPHREMIMAVDDPYAPVAPDR
jgi:hypothetical protein